MELTLTAGVLTVDKTGVVPLLCPFNHFNMINAMGALVTG